MKKKFAFFILASFLLLLSLSIVSAQRSEVVNAIKDFGTGVVEVLSPVLEIFVGPYADKGESGDFLMRILFLIIVFAILYIAFDKIGIINDNKFVHWLLTAAVAILAVRWLSGQELIQAILLPYSVLGIAFSAGLPFVLYFLVVNDFPSQTQRKLAWIFFGVIFIALWIARYDDLATVTTESGKSIAWAGYIYFATALLALIMIIFDGTFSRWRHKIRSEKVHHLDKIEDSARIRKEWNDLKKKLSKREITKEEFKELKKALVKKAKEHKLAYLVK